MLFGTAAVTSPAPVRRPQATPSPAPRPSPSSRPPPAHAQTCLYSSSHPGPSPPSPSQSPPTSTRLSETTASPATQSPPPPPAQTSRRLFIARQMPKHMRHLRRVNVTTASARNAPSAFCSIESASHPDGRSTATTGARPSTISRSRRQPAQRRLEPRPHHRIHQQLRVPKHRRAGPQPASSATSSTITAEASLRSRSRAAAASPFTSSIRPSSTTRTQPRLRQHPRRHKSIAAVIPLAAKHHHPLRPGYCRRQNAATAARHSPSASPAAPRTPPLSAGPPLPISAAVRISICPFYAIPLRKPRNGAPGDTHNRGLGMVTKPPSFTRRKKTNL